MKKKMKRKILFFATLCVFVFITSRNKDEAVAVFSFILDKLSTPITIAVPR